MRIFLAGEYAVLKYPIFSMITAEQSVRIAICAARMRNAVEPPNDIDRIIKRRVPRTRGWTVPVSKVDSDIGLISSFETANRSRRQVSIELNQQHT